MIEQVSKSGLACIAGLLAGTADRRLGTGTLWTMAVYSKLGKIDIQFLTRLEGDINRELKARNLREVSIAECVRAALPLVS